MKSAPVFQCQACGYQASGWLGRCPNCGEWDSLKEKKEAQGRPALTLPEPKTLSQIDFQEEPRFSSGFLEFDRVLGGGVVMGSVVLVGGEPGIGKSTLLLQVASNLSEAGKRVFYVSGEESLSQIVMRAKRLGCSLSEVYLLSETDAQVAIEVIKENQPEVVIIDSIQSFYFPEVSSLPGSPNQLRETTLKIVEIAKKQGITFFLIGQVTKEGQLAGPKIIEHLVDTVLYFESSLADLHRIIRAVKNRFGSTDEVGIFEMAAKGLQEVKNPTTHFVSEKKGRKGVAVAAVMEGSRPFLLEFQSLTNKTFFPNPRRISLGIDLNRLLLILAILEKNTSLRLFEQDIYLSTAGGLRLNDPAADLAVLVSVYSSLRDLTLPDGVVFLGEIGLGGDLRPVPFLNLRLKETAKLGFKWAVLPKYDKIEAQESLKLIQKESVEEVLELLSRDDWQG